MAVEKPSVAAADPLAAAARTLGLTRAGMVVERLARALWLPGSLALIGAALWAFDLHTKLRGDAAFWTVAALGLAILLTLALGLWRRNAVWAMLGGAVTLAALTWIGA